MKKVLKYSLIVWISLISRAIFAQTKWESAAHLGYAQSTSNVYSGTRAGGSYLSLDATRIILPQLTAGIRTTGSGAAYEEAQSYRMATGPALSLHLEGGMLTSGLSYFRESAIDSSGNATGLTTGYSSFVGWSHTRELSKRLWVDWGVSVLRYWGRFVPANEIQSQAFSDSRRDQGYMRSVDIALRMRL